MTDSDRIAYLEAQVETVSLARDECREMLREMGKENAKLRAALNLHREALADHRREFKRLARIEAALRKIAAFDRNPIDTARAALSEEEEGTPAWKCKTCEDVGLVEVTGSGGIPHTIRCPYCSPSPATPRGDR